MIIIACVDERNGMLFNHRRQSRDSFVCQDILDMCEGKELYLSPYSGKLFEGINEAGDKVQIRIADDFLKQAKEGDICFVEDAEIAGLEEQIQQVILYQWNRRYPADRYFPIDLSDGTWELKQTEEFKGSSHEKITKEVYQRKR